MSVLNTLENMSEHAKKYSKVAQKSIQRNNHMNEINEDELVQQKHIDAVLVDFINYIGMYHGFDYGIYTKDLK